MMKRCLVAMVMAAVLTSSFAISQESNHPALRDPTKANEQAPASFKAIFETTKGKIVFECTRDWAPHGVDRFYNLVKIGFFHDNAVFRVKKGFVVQWGIHGNPDVSQHWREARLPADPVKESNTKGMLTFAMAGPPTTRTTQVFINYANNARLDGMKFAPICKVVEGMEVAEAFNGEYDESPSQRQGDIQSKGNAFLKATFPNLDYITKTSIEGEAPAETNGKTSEGLPGDEDDNWTLYAVIAIVIIGGAIFFMRKKEDEAPEPPRKKTAAKKKSTKKKTTKKKSTTKKKKKKKRASKKKPSED